MGRLTIPVANEVRIHINIEGCIPLGVEKDTIHLCSQQVFADVFRCLRVTDLGILREACTFGGQRS